MALAQSSCPYIIVTIRFAVICFSQFVKEIKFNLRSKWCAMIMSQIINNNFHYDDSSYETYHNNEQIVISNDHFSLMGRYSQSKFICVVGNDV